MANTNLDEIIEYINKVAITLSRSQEVISLITNDPTTPPEDVDLIGSHIFDYDYVDDTTVETSAFICLDVEIPRVQNENIKDIDLRVFVICHKNYMRLDGKIFKGRRGNRRDNLAREIDALLQGNKSFGIGKLNLEAFDTITVPSRYTGKILQYSVSDFNIRRDRR